MIFNIVFGIWVILFFLSTIAYAIASLEVEKREAALGVWRCLIAMTIMAIISKLN